MNTLNNTKNQGSVISVKGSVVDEQFPQQLPAIYSMLEVQDLPIKIEVLSHFTEPVYCKVYYCATPKH